MDQGPKTGVVRVGWGGAPSILERPSVQPGVVMNGHLQR